MYTFEHAVWLSASSPEVTEDVWGRGFLPMDQRSFGLEATRHVHCQDLSGLSDSPEKNPCRHAASL